MSGAPSATGPRRPRVDAVGLLLPAAWWTIDLRGEDSRRRSVAQLVAEQVAGDDRAALRADLRSQLETAAGDAARAGGRLMAVSLMRAGDVPVPATVTVYRVAGSLSGEQEGELEAQLRASASPDDSLEAAVGPAGPVLRRVSTRTGPARLGAEAVPLLVVDYWLEPGDARGLLYFAFSSPLVAAREPLMELFDAIVSSVGPAEEPSLPLGEG